MRDGRKCGEYIRKKRVERGLTRSELAKKLGVGVYDVDGWEAGFFPPETMVRPLAEALGVREEDLLAGEDGAEPEEAQTPPAEPETPREEEKAEETREAEKTAAEPARPPESASAEVPPKPAEKPKKPKKPKKSESYYDEVKKRVANIDWDNPESVLPPAGADGFTAKEKRIGRRLCMIFIAIVVLFQAGRLVNRLIRGKELTLENYQNYLEISVVATDAVTGGVAVFNPDCYKVKISSKRDAVRDFSIVVEVAFYEPFSVGVDPDEDDLIYRTVYMSKSYFSSGSETFRFDSVVMNMGFEVISVEGRLP